MRKKIQENEVTDDNLEEKMKTGLFQHMLQAQQALIP